MARRRKSESFRAEYPLVNFLRVCMGLDPLPYTPRGYRQGPALIEALAALRRAERESWCPKADSLQNAIDHEERSGQLHRKRVA